MSTKAFARLAGVSLRQIYYWRGQGLPVDDLGRVKLIAELRRRRLRLPRVKSIFRQLIDEPLGTRVYLVIGERSCKVVDSPAEVIATALKAGGVRVVEARL